MVLDEGELVILDADFIYDENDSNINYANNRFLYDEFEKRYQNEKRKLKELEESQKIVMTREADVSAYDVNENRGIHR